MARLAWLAVIVVVGLGVHVPDPWYETNKVGGVETRIVEERETKRGSLVEAGTGATFAALEATTSVAQAAAQQSAPPAGGTGLQAPSSLAQAVRVAERQTGGRARKAEMERERGIDVYEIKTVSKDGSAKVLVDPASGSVLRVDTPWLANVFDRDDQREDHAAFARLDASSMTLSGAIDAAQKETGGRAVKAALKSQYGSTLFAVTVVRDWVTRKVLVDPATAKVVTLPTRGERKDDDD
jgi:uncharacterized membrane protein YkoI